MAEQDQDQGREPLNREERRALKHGGDIDRGDPGAAPGTRREAAFKGGNEELDSQSGTGTGGATESDGRIDNHEGIHLGHQPNS